MGKIGQQKHLYPLPSEPGRSWPWNASLLGHNIRPFTSMDLLLGVKYADSAMPAIPGTPSPPPQGVLTPDILDEKQALLHQITRNIAVEVGKISQDLWGEITQIGEHTDALENTIVDLVQYVQVLEEENSALKHSVP